MTTENERRRFYVGADMDRPGDETTRSRARTPKSDNIQSYDTIGGTAYGEHRKAAVGWTEGPTSAASGLLP